MSIEKPKASVVPVAFLFTFAFVGVMGSPAPLRAQQAECPGGELAGRTYVGTFRRIEFGCRQLTEFDGRRPEGEWERVYPYSTEERSGLTFVVVPDHEVPEWLVLYNEEFMFVYHGEGEPPAFRGATGNGRSLEAMYSFPHVFSATSSLTEGEVRYLPANLGRLDSRAPWVEAAPGHGLGEEVRFFRSFDRFWISIGFVSYTRPALYTMNSRPRRVRVVDRASGEEYRFELEDTPNPQPISVPGGSSGELREFRLIIDEVYEGTSFEDTCINFILYH